MTVDREQLQAAGGEGFEVLLHSLRLDQRRRAGKLACKFCRQQLDLEEIAAVFPESGDVKVVCSKPQCITALGDRVSEGKVRL